MTNFQEKTVRDLILLEGDINSYHLLKDYGEMVLEKRGMESMKKYIDKVWDIRMADLSSFTVDCLERP